MRPARPDGAGATRRAARSWRPLLPTLTLALLAPACRPEPAAISVACAVQGAGAAEPARASGIVGRGDTLDVRLHVTEPPRSNAVRLMVRVDPLSEPGAVAFGEGAPGTAAAVALALTEAAVFQGCLGRAPSGFRLLASAAPRARAWLRVSADRPVTVWLTVGREGMGGRSARISVAPGASGETSWRSEAP